MINRKVIDDFLFNNLALIKKPGRYVGGEYNQIIKNWEDVSCHVALVFPDIYDIGFSNNGINILYNIINKRNDALAERSFSPWIDMEELMRDENVPLYTLESKTPLIFYDLIGISIPYETLYTNVLNLLDLGEIPIFSKDRKEKDPIIIAGGHTTFNPEPMHSFIDLFIIGDGEEVINEIIEQVIAGKKINSSRNAIIYRLSQIPGVYDPSHFRVSYNSDSTIKAIVNNSDHNVKRIQKRVFQFQKPLDMKFLVPNIRVVHDRVPIEIMRGCSRGCRFCQAGFITRPVRELNENDIIMAMRNYCENTGIREVSLLSLSTSDYSEIELLIHDLIKYGEQNNLEFSLPSLRIESFDDALISSMKNKRKGNFTIAPEAGSLSMRNRINKPIPENSIFNTIENITKMGWNNIKLYFMIGFPEETMDDVMEIIQMCEKINSIGKANLRNRFKLHVSINTLIPKPHTPFQWVAIDSLDSIQEKYKTISRHLRPLKIKLDYPDINNVLLESFLSRGDRRIADVIYSAWKLGAKFDAWNDFSNFETWQTAFQEYHIDPFFYSNRKRKDDEIFPWDHIHTGVNKTFLIKEYRKSMTAQPTPACFEKCENCGIQSNFNFKCIDFSKRHNTP